MKKSKVIAKEQKNPKYLYTFILDYLEGTYISQVQANSQIESMPIWLENLEIAEIPMFTESDGKKSWKMNSNLRKNYYHHLMIL